MQLIMNFNAVPMPPKHISASSLWIDVIPKARMIGFVQKVEISQQLIDALQSQQFEAEDAYEQRLYDALWLAHRYLSLDQRSSFSFTFDYLQDDPIAGRLTKRSIRLRLETDSDIARLGLLNDF